MTAEEEKSVSVKADFLADVNMDGDDREEITASQLKKLDRLQQFEVYFPFYLMDINGYNLLLKTARINTYKDAEEQLFEYQIEDISYAELKEAFKNHDSWSALNDESSELMQFLKETSLFEGSPTEGPDMRFSSYMLRVIGLMWCEGAADEKVVEFYDNMQDNNQVKIAADDKDFQLNLNKMFDLSTSLLFQLEVKYGANKGAEPAFTAEKVQEVKDSEQYDVLREEFLNEVFGYESILERNDWSELVEKKQAWIFSPSKIREKLGYKLK